MTPLVETKNLFKWYANNFVKAYVLCDVNLTVEEGEFVSIMGPSGSGKSTLLHILGLLDEPSDGDQYFLGEEVHKLRPKDRVELHKNHIGFVFQSYHLIDDLTVYENLETPLLYKKIQAAERKSLVADILDRFQIVGRKDLFPRQLSGGSSNW